LRPGPSPHGAASQQPVLILQELPGPGAAPAGPPRVRGDLMELMMIQNSQMHQVVMNSLAVAALTSFGLGPSLAPAQVLPGPEEEEEAVVFHHHYIPIPGPVPIPVGPLPIPGRAQGPAAVRFLGSLGEDEGRAVPPPPPPSATGTVGPQVPPAAGEDSSHGPDQ
ncbi:PRR29 protein, partial [Menura novaehollandiae]|nr:PRR29 protein [Menura novaehollandiae]